MRRPRVTKPQLTSLYQIRFRPGDGIAELSDVEKDHLRHLLFSVSQALFVGVEDYAITSRGLDVILKVPKKETADRLSDAQILHLMGFMRGEALLHTIAHGLSHPVPRLRLVYSDQLGKHRKMCCDLSSFGKILAKTFSCWWKIRHPGNASFWRERFSTLLLENALPETISTARSVLRQKLVDLGIEPDRYPWCGISTPAPAHPGSVRSAHGFHLPASSEKNFRVRKTDRKASGKTPVSRRAVRPNLKERINVLLGTGLAQSAIAAKVDCSRPYVSLVRIERESGKLPGKAGRKPLPDAAHLTRKQAQTLRDALNTRIPPDFGLSSGGFNRPWNRVNIYVLCRRLFGLSVSRDYLDALLVSWRMISLPQPRRKRQTKRAAGPDAPG